MLGDLNKPVIVYRVAPSDQSYSTPWTWIKSVLSRSPSCLLLLSLSHSLSTLAQLASIDLCCLVPSVLTIYLVASMNGVRTKQNTNTFTVILSESN